MFDWVKRALPADNGVENLYDEVTAMRSRDGQIRRHM